MDDADEPWWKLPSTFQTDDGPGVIFLPRSFSQRSKCPWKKCVAKEGHGEHFLSYFRLVFLVTFRGFCWLSRLFHKKGRTGSS